MPDISVRPVHVLISLSCQSVPVRPAAAERLPAVICRPAPSAPPVPDPVHTKGLRPARGRISVRGRSLRAAPAQKGRLFEQARRAQ